MSALAARRPLRRLAAAGCWAAAALIFSASCRAGEGMPQDSAAAPQPSGNPADPKTIDAGRALFTAKNCVFCHGAGGTGGVRLAGNSLDPQTAHDTIANGRIRGNMRMPAWKGVLTEDEIWQLTAYVMSLK